MTSCSFSSCILHPKSKVPKVEKQHFSKQCETNIVLWHRHHDMFPWCLKNQRVQYRSWREGSHATSRQRIWGWWDQSGSDSTHGWRIQPSSFFHNSTYILTLEIKWAQSSKLKDVFSFTFMKVCPVWINPQQLEFQKRKAKSWSVSFEVSIKLCNIRICFFSFLFSLDTFWCTLANMNKYSFIVKRMIYIYSIYIVSRIYSIRKSGTLPYPPQSNFDLRNRLGGVGLWWQESRRSGSRLRHLTTREMVATGWNQLGVVFFGAWKNKRIKR